MTRYWTARHLSAARTAIGTRPERIWPSRYPLKAQYKPSNG